MRDPERLARKRLIRRARKLRKQAARQADTDTDDGGDDGDELDVLAKQSERPKRIVVIADDLYIDLDRAARRANLAVQPYLHLVLQRVLNEEKLAARRDARRRLRAASRIA